MGSEMCIRDSPWIPSGRSCIDHDKRGEQWRENNGVALKVATLLMDAVRVRVRMQLGRS